MVSAMLFINSPVYGPVFLALFLGLAVVSVTFAIGVPSLAESPATKLIIAIGATYFACVVFVTVVFNMLMNQFLDAMDPTSEFAAAYWTQYIPT